MIKNFLLKLLRDLYMEASKTKNKKKKEMYNRMQLFEDLKRDEGVVFEVYLDPLGYPTFGVGHLITSNDPEKNYVVGTPVNQERVFQAFKDDVETAIMYSQIVYGSHFDSWPGEVQEVIINMMFNLGPSKLKKFKKFRAALERRNWKEAAAEGRDSLWYKQVTNRAERLMARLEEIE